ncbi:MAG: SirA-like protein [Elusimicrobia bacterium RIFOXYB12_FULL_50_12]|nr:MAG: SirA-like protein [Elusimicrobia bacterium RIFOXYA12_FULL_49_49]OGS10138.1 MAG: SirA-like protein [Elusimicrobia bacterium RIFOXYB1_FULL_48_9]OGS16443.1 MAG: SirA-like protein [Elusimicrobia bacterium RIFOXYA2_FULL_47_53]OGS27182.1 MAG: SirA-like protein [Elusimicrobia bacterium RIFOXYB12_FULL_50_12]OGS30381.1 MAG: SirA-like protein [Elusimicrobia bacterium RIFOXYB2_FULL_46_23]
MAVVVVDANGLRCPQPVLRMVAKAPELKAGDVMEVLADCPTFAKDVQMWSERAKKTLLFCRDEGGGKFRAQIQF